MALSEIELRVVGALVEKERVTPDAYPLSTQSLVTACNQRTSRDPVTDYHMQEVLEALQKLRDKGLAGTRQEVSDRVPKHSHRLAAALDVNANELGLLSVLMLRGPQTAGELRTRTERYGMTLTALPEYEECLRSLAERSVPLVRNVGRAPGQSQDRWQHTLGYDEDRLQPRVRRPESHSPAAALVRTTAAEPNGAEEATHDAMTELVRRVEELEERVAQLEARLGD